MKARGHGFRVRAGYRHSHLARHLWKTTALSTFALALSGMAAHGGQDGLWQPQIRAIIGADNNGANTAIEGFLPLKQNLESVLFLDVRSKYDFQDGFGQDVGLGVRRIVNPDLMIGGYAYLNIQNSDSHQFVASTLGLEAITSKYDAHVNVYLPISGDVKSDGFDSTLSLVGNQLLEQISAISHRDYAAWGIEGEVGIQAPIDLPEKHSLRFDVGAYHFADPDGEDRSITGAKAGFEYTIGDVIGTGTELTFTGEVRNDNRDNTQFAGSVRLTVPLNAPGKGSSADDEPVFPVGAGLRKRVNERVRGDIGVRIESADKVTGNTTRVAINAATGTAFGKFFFADGDNDALGLGTIGDPTTLDKAVAGAGANGFVVALGGKGNITTAGVTLANGQTVIGGGGSVKALLFNGSTSSFTFGGSSGTIQGTNVGNNVITLGNANTLSGITITGGADGIFGNNISGATLTNVTVTGAGGNGADFTGTSTNISASNFTATGNGLDGLHIDGDGTYNFTGTTLLQGNLDDGLDVTGDGTYSFATVNALNNADRGITVQGTSVSGSFTTTGGTVSGNGGIGVFIDPITAHVVLDSISQTGGVSGVVLDAVSGSFTVNGNTTISGTSGPAIAISNSPATIRFGDINISAPGGDGMSFAGVNAAVIAGNIVISGLGVGTGLDFSGSQTNFTAQSLNITGTGAAGSIGIDLTSPSAGGATIIITNGGAIANVDTGVRFGISGSLANSANAQFTFGGGSIAGITASLDARGLNQTLGLYAFGSTTFSGPQLFDPQNLIFIGSSATGTGDGSSLANLVAVGTADANTSGTAIFVLVNDVGNTPIDAAGGFTLSAGQTLASFGNGRTFSLGGIPVNVTGTNVQHATTISDPNGAATLTNSGAGDVVTLANNSSLLDFNINGGSANGVHGSNVSAVTISGLNVSGAGLDGVLFDGTNGVTANNLNSSGNTGNGVLIDHGDGTYNFTGTTTLSNNTGHGLFIVGGGNYGFETLDAKNNGGVGVFVNSTGGGTLTTTGGTISGNGLAAFDVVTFGIGNSIGLDVTLDTVSQSGGQNGIGLTNVGGNFSVTGTTTVSNTLFDGIFISSSSATVDFGGAATITQPSRNGIALSGNSGAITFGDVSISQPGENGIDVSGTNGTIGFANIDITNLPTGKTGLDLSGSQSTFTATSLDITGAGTSTGIDLSGTTGGSVTIGTGVISVGTGVQMGTHGAAGTSADTTFSFGAAGGASITGTTASLDMRGLLAGNGTYAFNTTVLNGPQLFDAASIIFVGAADTGTGSGADVNDLINAAAADDLTTDANTIFVLVDKNGGDVLNTDADGFTLANGQSVVSFANGQVVDLGAPPANVTGTNVVTGATQADPFGNGAATLNNGAGSAINLADGNLIQNLIASNTGSGAAIDGSGSNGLIINGVTISSAVTGVDLTGASGTIGVTNLNIQAAQNGIVLANSAATASFTDTTMGGVTGTGLSLNNYSGTATFTNFDITGAGTGVSITGGSTGTMTFDAASSIAGTTGIAFNIDSSQPNVTYNGTINQTAAASAVKINAMTGGTATFGGKITASTGAANAIDLTGNTGGTINFNGGLDLTTDGGFAFSAINGGTLSVTGSNTVATGANLIEKGIQLGGVGGLTIGAAGVTFASVTVDGSGGSVPTGIVIENTGGGNVTFGAVNINRVNGDAIRLTNVGSGIYTFGGTTTIDTVVGGGAGFVVQGSAATVNVNNLVTTLVSGADVSLTNNTGTIAIGGTITNSGSGDGVVVSGGSAAITVSAGISSSATAPGTAVKVDGITGGSVTFSGNVTSTGTGNLFNIGSTTAPTGGTVSFTGSTLTATGGGGAVIGGLGVGATFNATAALSVTNATGNGLSVANVAGSATFGAVTVSGAGANGIDISGNSGSVTLGTTKVTMGAAANTAGINFAGTNADVTFGTTTIDNVGANQTGIDFSGSATTADFGLTTITGLGDLTSRGIDLSSTSGNKVITFLQGSKIDNLGVGVELSSGGTTATSANATFTFGDGDSTDGLESFIIAAAGGFTVNTVGLDPTLGNYDFDDVFFTGSANLATAPGSVTLVSQSGGFIAQGTTGNLSMGVNTISLAAADALTGAQNFAFVGTINLGATTFTLDSGQTITGFGNNNVVSTGTIQPANVQGNLGATGGNISGDEAVVSGTANLMQLLGDNAVRHTAFDFSSATGAAFLIDQSAVGFSNASGITIEGVTIINVAAGQTAIKVVGLDSNLTVINNNINVAGTLLDVNGGTGTISVSRGILPNSATPGTLTGGGINIANRTGGAVTFTDQATITGGNGVSISGGSAAAAVNFNGGLDITTSATTGLSLSGLNVLTVANAGSTTINATGQTALSLQGTLGAGGVNFDSITSSGGTSGIILNGVTGAVNVSGATSITGTSGFGIDITGANTGTFTFGAVTVNNTATAGGGIHVVSGTVNVTGLANIDTTSGVGLSQSGGTTSFTGGLTIDTTTGTGIAGTGGTMGITATGGAETVNSTLGQAISLSGVAATIALDSTSSGGGTNNVSLSNVSGTVNLGTGALGGASGVAFLLNGGAATVSYGGTVTKTTAGNVVDISGVTGGTVTLSGNLSATGGFDNGIDVHTNTGGTFNFNGAMTLSTGASPAVSLIANTGAVINFGGGLGITTTSGTGFNATGGGTISVTGANTISTGSGTALNLNGVTVGTGGVNFNSISVNGAATGIALNNIASSGGGAIALGTVNLQGITSRGVDVSGTLGAALSFTNLDIGLNSTTGVAFDLNGATINAAVTADDFDVTNAAAAGTSIGVDLRGAIGGQTVRLGDAVVGGASSSIAGVNTGVFLNSTTNLAFVYGDGESATDQNSTISANVGIDAASAPVAGTYNFQDVNFQANPGNGFGLGKIYFVGATATGDGTGRDQNNLATLTTAEAAAVASDILVLVNDGGAITAAGSNGNDTLVLLANEQVRGFDNGNINLALTVPSTIQLASNSLSIADQTPGGTTTLTTTDGNNVITLGASGNIIDGFIIDGNDGTGLNAAIGISGSVTANATISNMTIRNFTAADIDFGTGATGTTTLTNLTLSAGAATTAIKFGAATGTVTATNVDTTGGSGLSVVGGNAAFIFDSTSSTSSVAGTAVSITNRTGGSFGYAGTITTGVTAGGIVISGATGVNTVSFTGAVTHNATGAAVSINNGGLASTVSFANLAITTGSVNTAFTATNGGTVNVTTGSISAGAQAVNLNGIAAGINFTSITSGGGVNNVALTNVTGTVDLGSGALSGATGAAFLVSGGTANISYAGSVTKTTAGNVVSISSRTGGTTTLSGNLSATGGVANGILVNGNTGGTINFSGATKTLTTGANNAVDLTTNAGTAINFSGGGLAITTTSGIGFNASGGTITVTGSGNTISTGSGVAVNMDTVAVGAGGVTFASTNKGAGGTSAVILDTVTGAGAIDLGTGALIGGTSAVIRIGDGAGTANSGGTAAFTYAGTMTSGSGRGIDIQDRAAGAGNITLSGNITHNVGGQTGIFLDDNAAGTITFSGASKSITSTTANGVSLSDNAGVTINFTNGGLVISTTSGIGFNATGVGPAATTGGTVTVQGTGNTITSTTGTALNVVNTTIGASDVTFQSISANGAVNGIVLNNTGASGGLTVTGDGATSGGQLVLNGTGGTIQNTTGDSVVLTNAFNINLRQMNITNAGLDGVQSIGGGNIKLSAVNITNPGASNPLSDGSSGNPAGFGGGNGWFAQNITGVNAFDNNSKVSGWQSSQSNGVLLFNTNTSFTSFTVDHALFTTSATGADGFLANLFGTTSGTVNVTSSEFTLIDQDAVQISNQGSGTVNAIVQKSNFHDADNTSGDGNNTLYLSNSANGVLNFTIGGPTAADGNTFHNLARLTTLAGVVQVDAAGGSAATPDGGQINGSIRNNTISNDVGFVNGRRAIDVQVEADSHDLGKLAVLISDNTINNVSKQGVHVSVVSVGGGSVTDANWTIQNNHIGDTSPVGTEGNVDSGSAIEFETNFDSFTSGADMVNNLLIQGNIAVNNANNATGATFDISNIGGTAASGTTAVLNATILNNTLTNNSTTGGHVLDVLNSSAGDGETLNLNISGNNTTLGASTLGEIRLRQLNGTFNIQGGIGAVSGNNNGDTLSQTGSFGTVGSVTLPSLPTGGF